jgi:tRNA(fMet)-specific endonuclease VapC
LFNGWAGRINDPKESNNLLRIYTKLWQTTEFFKTIEILPFNEAANSCYQLLIQDKSLAKKRLEKDVRIAAIALAVDETVVTRNNKDFSQIPNLKIEDWSV